MESIKSKNRPLLIAILVIVSINLILMVIAFSFFMIAVLAEWPTAAGETTEVEPLPKDLATEEHRAQLFAEFRLNYNSGDNEQLLSIFGEAYQLQLRANDFDQKSTSIRNIAPIINEGAYEYYEFERLETGVAEFRLYYQIDTPEGLRKLRMTFRRQGDGPSSLAAFEVSF